MAYLRYNLKPIIFNSNKSSTVNSRYLEVLGTIFYKFKLPEVQINLGLVKKSPTPNYGWRKQSKSNQNVFLFQKDASSFAEFEISEFEISRFDCNIIFPQSCRNGLYLFTFIRIRVIFVEI